MTHRWIVRGWDRVRHDVLGRETRHPVARVAGRLLVGIVVSGTVALPFALEHGIEQTRVHDRIGVVPPPSP